MKITELGAIPMPPRTHGGTSPLAAALAAMAVNDAISVEGGSQKSIASSVSRIGKSLGMKFKCRKDGESTNVWRVE